MESFTAISDSKVSEVSCSLLGELCRLYKTWACRYTLQLPSPFGRKDLIDLALKQLTYTRLLYATLVLSDPHLIQYCKVPLAVKMYSADSRFVRCTVGEDSVSIFNSLDEILKLGDVKIKFDGTEIWNRINLFSCLSSLYPGVVLALLFANAQCVDSNTYCINVPSDVKPFRVTYVEVPFTTCYSVVSTVDFNSLDRLNDISRVDVSYDGDDLIFKKREVHKVQVISSTNNSSSRTELHQDKIILYDQSR